MVDFSAIKLFYHALDDAFEVFLACKVIFKAIDISRIDGKVKLDLRLSA